MDALSVYLNIGLRQVVRAIRASQVGALPRIMQALDEHTTRRVHVLSRHLLVLHSALSSGAQPSYRIEQTLQP